jgi:uncharacterized protein (TIGR03437 family)
LNLLSRLLTGVVLTGIAYAQPTIDSGGVTNAASYALPELPNGALARGGMIVIKGNNLGPAELQIINAFPLPLTLAGTSIKATVNGTAVDLYMIYTSAKQLAAILPSQTPEGNGTLTVTYNGQTTAAAQIRVVRSAFGMFTLNQGGSGPGVFQNANSGTDQPVNTLTVGARPGQLVIIWGTGLGPVTENEATGARPGDMPSVPVEVYVGGKRADVTYRGRSGCCAGIDQIVFTVPQGVEGCYVPVVVKVGDVVSNFTTMTVSSRAGSCTDLSGMTSTQLESAQRSGTLRTGGIALTRTVSKFSVPGFGGIESKSDDGSAYFSRYNFDQLLRAQGIGGGSFTSTVLGSCTVFTARGGDTQGVVDVTRPVTLDAGPVININGPKGAKQLTKQQGGGYFANLGGGTPSIPGFPGGGAAPDYLEPGEYQISNGSGGSGPDAVGAFSAKITIPQLLNWTNMDSVETVNRAAGQEVTWTGGDPGGYVYMFGLSSSGRSSNAAVSLFYCTERTSAGRFTIPSYVLSTLPATTGQNIGLLSVNSVVNPVTFTASGLDSGVITATSGSSKTVTFR